ncbi:MAG: metallophosphoesterase [Myxococcales bacterium]|nr:metallophosphoesterase [Myxococcales bacterium]
MRLAHATDIHWFARPRLGQLAFKRVLGTANLYLRGRRHSFSRSVQRQLVQHIRAIAPDAVMITGDLTAQALPAEFEMARDDLKPMLDALPTFVVPGNHDVYTAATQRQRAMQQWFEPWMGLQDSGLARIDVGRLTLLGLDPNRATWLAASGRIPSAQLSALSKTLHDPELADQAVVLALHYPVVDRRGTLYDNAAHGLLNASELVSVLEDSPHRPQLIACGHVHHGFRSELRLSDGTSIPVCNCGSSGQAHQPDRRRAAAMAVYELRPDGSVGYERFVHDGTAFAPEPGGPWATGR